MERSLSIKPDTTAEELAELIKTGNANVCQQVAQHPNTSPKTLKSLFVNFPVEVLNNPVIDLLLLENTNFFTELYSSNSSCFKIFTLPLFYLEWAIDNINYAWIRSYIAESIKTPLSILDKLALDKESAVRSCVASNPNISENIVDRLAKDKDTNVRSAVASNKNTPEYILEKLAEDRDIYVVCNVANNLSTSLETLEKLSQHQAIGIRKNVANNPNISLKIMKRLVEDSEDSVKTALAANKKIPSSLLNELADSVLNNKYNIGIASSILYNPNITPELKQKLYSFYQENKEKFKLSPKFYFNAIKHYTDLEMKRVNWTKEIGRDHLLITYGKRSRLHLTDSELVEFWHYLMDLPTPNAELDNKKTESVTYTKNNLTEIPF